MMKKTGTAVAAIMAGSFTILLIGILFIASEASEPLHAFLEFIPAVGALSGKIIISYSAGILMFFVLRQFLKNKNPSIMKWTTVSIIILMFALLFSFMPFIELLI